MDEDQIEQGSAQKKVYILLTKQTDAFSRIFGIMSGCGYFHASIGFEERGVFYSFNTKRGFCIEQPAIRRQYVPCVLYSLDVTDEAYEDIKARIDVFLGNTDKTYFAGLGMFLAIFRMPLKIPFLFVNSYFCSMFVSELIIKSGAAKLKVKPHRYLPRHFPSEPELKLCFEGVWGSPPEFSEDHGDLYAIPIRYAKRYVRKARKTARVSVKIARRNANRTVRIARSKIAAAKSTVLLANGKFYGICKNNFFTVTRISKETLKKWGIL